MRSIFNFNSDRFDVRMGFDLSIFNTIEEATKARKEAELKYFGEYRNKD